MLGLVETHPKVRTLARWAEWFIRRSVLNRRDQGTWLVIHGPTGVGKTHVGQVVVRFFNDWAVDLSIAGVWPPHRVPVATFIDWPKAIRKTEENDPETVFHDALSSQVIVIDDLGAETDRFKSGLSADVARTFFSDIEGKFVLMNTNCPRHDIEARFGERVADRMDAAHRHDMTGAPSYRPLLKAGA